jgi:transposase-like protein
MGTLKEGEAGVAVKELSRKYGICDQTYYRWKAKYGGSGGERSAVVAAVGGREPAAEAHRGRAGFGHPGAQRGTGKKVLTPAAGRKAVGVMRSEYRRSEWRHGGLF